METNTQKFGKAVCWFLEDDYGHFIKETYNFDEAYDMYFNTQMELNPNEDDENDDMGECIIWLMEEDEQGNTRVHYINY